ncbi:MAG: hypothetical protein AB7S98_25475, partial [Burkholderiaceae bacterium]
GEDDVRIVVARKAGSSLAAPALMDWLQGRMPRFMMPRYIEFIDVLPRNPAGKIEKYKLLDAGLAPTAWDRDAAGAGARAVSSPGRSLSEPPPN